MFQSRQFTTHFQMHSKTINHESALPIFTGALDGVNQLGKLRTSKA